MNKVLIDSDVLLDFFLDREPFVTHASNVIELIEKKEIKGFVTPIIISNLYYILRRISSHKIVLEKIALLLQLVSVTDVSNACIINAVNSNFKDFEDALQNFSAEMSGLTTIITRNTKDYKTSNLSVFTPESFIKALASKKIL